MKDHAISPTRKENYAEWYQEVIRQADLAENAPVRGCMIIKPWGYAIWERIQKILDGQIKASGHCNAYFPLFIPKSFLEKEAAHVEGFATQCAVVTHGRLVKDGDGKLIAAGPLEEELIVRPTSETIIGSTFARWIQSYRDLPLLINQWANVVRWEMRPRLFLRTSEFLWQEGHTAHETEQEAWQEARAMLELYRNFLESDLALPVYCGKKSQAERFPGADETFCLEAMMQDGKALQAGTSHFLGRHFSRAYDIQFLGRQGKKELAWTTSWGMTTRLIGALIMVHGDDDGLVLPPTIAPTQVVILPVIHGDDRRPEILAYAAELKKALEDQTFDKEPLRVLIDDRDLRGGEKFWHWTKKGVPLCLEVGPRELDSRTVSLRRRHQDGRESLESSAMIARAPDLLRSLQSVLFQRAMDFQRSRTQPISTYGEFVDFFAHSTGFARTYFCGNGDDERRIRAELGVTLRCIPLATEQGSGPCFCHENCSGRPVLWARSY